MASTWPNPLNWYGFKLFKSLSVHDSSEDAHAVPKMTLSYFLMSRSRLDLRTVFVEMSFTGRYYQMTMAYYVGL